MPCENHSQIAAAKRVSAYTGGLKRSLTSPILRAGLDKLSGIKPGSNNKKQIENS